MLLTLTTTHRPATDLGYLLAKNPARVQTFELPFGKAHVYYPEATEERCTAALLLDIDPVGLVRRPRGDDAFALYQYTNDRPYVASSFMSVALGRVFGSALGGRCRDRPQLVDHEIPLEARLAVVAVRGGEPLLRRLFEPLGYAVAVERHRLDEHFSQWGDGPYFTVTLTGRVRLSDLLRHLAVLIPVMDDNKHYWIGSDEVDKLLDRGEGWLSDHPEREQIAQRYLKHRRSLTREALHRLADDDDPDPEGTDQARRLEEEALEAAIPSCAAHENKPPLHAQRTAAVVAALRRNAVRRVVDVGCGEGKLLRELLRDRDFERVVGMDVSVRSLERARDRLHLDEMSDRGRARIQLFHGSLTYRDERLAGFDGACAVEVMEHIEPSRLAAFERVLFEYAHPGCVVVTTPNVEYNARFETLPAGKLRHRDHRFEWTRAEFETWARGVAGRHGYTVEFEPIGPVDPEHGAPTQMGVFVR